MVAQPLVRPELAVLDTLPRGIPAGQTLVACRDARVWQEFDHSMELVRLLVGEPELWTSAFRSSFFMALAPNERLSIPGEESRRVWVGSDATLTMLGFTDWTNKVYLRQDLCDPLRVLLCRG